MEKMKEELEDLFVQFFDTTANFAAGQIDGEKYDQQLAVIATMSEAYAGEDSTSQMQNLMLFTDGARQFYAAHGEDAARTCANMLCACYAEDHESFNSYADDLEVQLYLQELNIKQAKEK